MEQKNIFEKQNTKNGRNVCDENLKYLFENLDCITSKTVWLVGGDGWAYDIDFGGLDHIFASGENVNILVLDTELYSNTGGQMSKSTPLGATAKFCNAGKKTNKKNLALSALLHKDVYVAEVCLGADMNQIVRAFEEANDYDGVSLIIAYAPCINHGIDMSKNIEREAEAVKCGYWHLFRYNPELAKIGKNPLTIDSPKPTEQYESFLLKERRFAKQYDCQNKKIVIGSLQQNNDEFYNLLVKMRDEFENKK